MKAFNVVDYVNRDNTPSRVLPGLFVGSIGAAMDPNQLKDSNITHILSVAGGHNKQMFPGAFVYKTLDVKVRVDCIPALKQSELPLLT